MLPLFLLTENLNVLMPNFLKLKPGARIVTNGFTIDKWDFDAHAIAEGNCGQWCNVYLYVVPADVAGSWRLGSDVLKIEQDFQKISGTLGNAAIAAGRLRGAEIVFTVGKTQYAGRIEGDEMRGETQGAKTGAWTARRE